MVGSENLRGLSLPTLWKRLHHLYIELGLVTWRGGIYALGLHKQCKFPISCPLVLGIFMRVSRLCNVHVGLPHERIIRRVMLDVFIDAQFAYK
jgi:hypothetical protein